MFGEEHVAQELEVRIVVGGNRVLFIAETTLELLCWRFSKST